MLSAYYTVAYSHGQSLTRLLSAPFREVQLGSLRANWVRLGFIGLIKLSLERIVNATLT